MRKIILVITAILALGSLPLPADTQKPEVRLKYDKWLEEEVIYIITNKEREVFLALKTDQERNLFIQAFWKNRDPSPYTEENEFQRTHSERIKYADQHFGRSSSFPGWKTDRGRIFIILGPPTSIQNFDDLNYIHPALIWYYTDKSQYGIPDIFNIVFYKHRGTGDYKLYSPSMDGPENLVALHLKGTTRNDRDAAYEELFSASPLLANTALSLIPGESTGSLSSPLNSERLLADILSLPQKTIRDEYSEIFLKYKDIIEVEYTANYIGNDSLICVLRDETGISFVHYIMVLDRFSVNLYDATYSTKLSVNGKVSDLKGNTIFQFERAIPIQMNQAQVEKIQKQKAGIQDLFPLAEGTYRFSLLVKNEISKEFTSLEKEIIVPSVSETRISDLLLAYHAEESSISTKIFPFKVGRMQLYPSLRSDFAISDKIILAFQVQGIEKTDIKDLSLEMHFIRLDTKTADPIKIISRKFSDLDDPIQIIEQMDLKDFPAGYYKVRVSITDPEGREIGIQERPFSVAAVHALPRPWINSVIHQSAEGNPAYIMALAAQWTNKGEPESASKILEDAFRADPSHFPLALSFARVLFRLKQYEKVVSTLKTFSDQNNPEMYDLLSRSCHALGRYSEASTLYRNLISRYGTNYQTLSLLGDCHFRLGEIEEAVKAWEKSLEMKPDQPGIKILLDSIRKKKK